MATLLDNYYPFQNGPGADSGEDRWAAMARLYRETGVVPTIEIEDLGFTNQLEVYADGNDMNVRVKSGMIIVQGFVGENDSTKVLSIATADPTQPRIDLVVARLDRSGTEGKIEFDVLTGTPASSPAAETPTQNSSIWEEPLAEVYVDAGVTQIAASKVTNRAKVSAEKVVTFREAEGNKDLIPGVAWITTDDVTMQEFTLPEDAAPGDTVGVVGGGDAGWAIKSNANVALQRVMAESEISFEAEYIDEVLVGSQLPYDSVVLVCAEGGQNQTWVIWNRVGTYINTGGNYFGDGSDGVLTVSSDISLASAEDGHMVLKQYAELTIDEGYIMTVASRCKGLVIAVRGDCTINGTLSMTARGGYVDPVAVGVSSAGLRLPVLVDGQIETLSQADFNGCGPDVEEFVSKFSGIDGDGKIIVVERTGGAGGAATRYESHGNNGGTKTNGSGGGGSGASAYKTTYSGAGAAGTCFSGGSGGGGGSGAVSGDGVANGGPGGNAARNTDERRGAGGGAGNPGGNGVSGSDSSGSDGQTGTGGTLFLIVGGDLTIGPNARIEACGKNGGDSWSGGAHEKDAAGGGSGGGNIRILYAGVLDNQGTVSAAGGSGGDGAWKDGGDGGAGSIVIQQIDA